MGPGLRVSDSLGLMDPDFRMSNNLVSDADMLLVGIQLEKIEKINFVIAVFCGITVEFSLLGTIIFAAIASM